MYDDPPPDVPECGFVGELCPPATRGKAPFTPRCALVRCALLSPATPRWAARCCASVSNSVDDFTFPLKL